MRATIDLPEAEFAVVQQLLARYVPGCEVRAFGSRVTGGAERFSDLGLALLGDGPLPTELLEALRDAFSESDLSISVDVLDWRALAESFRRAIGGRYLVLRHPEVEPAEEPAE